MLLAAPEVVPVLFRFLAGSVELLHGVLMVAWGLGLPLLLWGRFPRLRRAYIWFSLSFVLGSLLSHWWFGECVLTRWAHWLWDASGGHAERVPFIVTFTNRVARIRPSTDVAVVLWEVAIVAYCVLGLWGWHWSPRPAPSRPAPSRARRSATRSADEC